MTDAIAKALRIAVSKTDRNPSDEQKKAGNYAKGKVRINGLNVAIENPKGGERPGVDKDGKRWSVRLPAAYGYVLGSEGADGDHLDVYIGPDHESGKVYVVDQVDANTGKYDEHKALLSYKSKKDALADYEKAFSDGKAKDRIGAVTEMSVDQFKSWVKSGNTKKPLGGGIYEGDMTKKPSAVSNALAVARKYASGGVVGYADGGAPGEWDWRSDMDAPAPGYDIRRGEVLPPYRPATELKEAQPGSVPTTREAAIDAILNYGTLPAEFTGVPAAVRGGKNLGRGIAEGDAARAVAGAAEGALGVLPGVGKVPGVGALISSVPKTVATGTALGATTLPLHTRDAVAEANASISDYINNDPEVRRLRAERDKVMSERVKVNEKHAKSGKETQKQALSPFNAQLEAFDGSADKPGLIGQAEERARKAFLADAPFRTRHPGTAEALFMGGLGMGAFLPFASNVKHNIADRMVHQPAIGRQAEAVELALKGGTKEPGLWGQLTGEKPKKIKPDRDAFNQEQDALDAMLAARDKRDPSFIKNASVGTGMAMESRMIPEEIDAISYDPGHPTRDKAMKDLSSPGYYLSGLVPSVIAGATVGGLAGKGADLVSKSESPAMARANRVREWDFDAKGPLPRGVDMPSIWESAKSIPGSWLAGKAAGARRIAAEEQRLALDATGMQHAAHADALEAALRADQARRRLHAPAEHQTSLRQSDQRKSLPSDASSEKSVVVANPEPSNVQAFADAIADGVARRDEGMVSALEQLTESVSAGHMQNAELLKAVTDKMTKAAAPRKTAAQIKEERYAPTPEQVATEQARIERAKKTFGNLIKQPDKASGGAVSPTVFLKTKHPAGHWQTRATNGKFASGGAVAAAMDTARRYASGGRVHVGPIDGDTGGRADKVPMDVMSGSYIWPADVVAGRGQGNTAAGQKFFDQLEATAMKNAGGRVQMARGGVTPSVAIKAADGERCSAPHVVAAIGGGDIKRGHAICDALVKNFRDDDIKTLAALPPPSK